VLFPKYAEIIKRSHERLVRSDVKYRFSLDTASLKAE